MTAATLYSPHVSLASTLYASRDTYGRQRLNHNVHAIFLEIGICRGQMVHIAAAKMVMSIKMLTIPKPIHVPLCPTC